MDSLQSFTLRLIEYNVETNYAQIELDGATMKVDTSLLTVFKHKIRSLFALMGTICLNDDNQPVLQARIIREMEALDINLFKKAMRIRISFEKERQECIN